LSPSGFFPLRDSTSVWPLGYRHGLPFKIFGTAGPLPVELSSFAANVFERDVALEWSTATETNNMGFEVERNFNDGAFAKIGFVNGNGTTTEPKEYSYIDRDLPVGVYAYRLRQIDMDGVSKYSDEIEVNMTSPGEYSLGRNFPNPFNPSTTIDFSLMSDGQVTLKLYNALGQEVKTLVSGNYTAGTYKIDFDGSGLNSGVYFYSLEASGVDGSNYFATKKMILMK